MKYLFVLILLINYICVLKADTIVILPKIGNTNKETIKPGSLVYVKSQCCNGIVLNIINPNEPKHKELILNKFILLDVYTKAIENSIAFVKLDKSIKPQISEREIDVELLNNNYVFFLKKKLLSSKEEMIYYEQRSNQPQLEIGWKKAKNEFNLIQDELNDIRNKTRNYLLDKKEVISIIPVSILDIDLIKKEKK